MVSQKRSATVHQGQDMRPKNNNGDDPMKNLDNLVDKLFNVVKEDVEKIEEAVEDTIQPTEIREADE